MSLNHSRLPDLSFPNGVNISNAIPNLEMEDAVAILLIAPAALDSLTYTIEIRRWGAATWTTLQEGDIGVALADVAPPAAGKSQCYEMSRLGISAGHSFRLKASSTVSNAIHVFEAIKLWEGM